MSSSERKNCYLHFDFGDMKMQKKKKVCPAITGIGYGTSSSSKSRASGSLHMRTKLEAGMAPSPAPCPPLSIHPSSWQQHKLYFLQSASHNFPDQATSSGTWVSPWQHLPGLTSCLVDTLIWLEGLFDQHLASRGPRTLTFTLYCILCAWHGAHWQLVDRRHSNMCWMDELKSH